MTTLVIEPGYYGREMIAAITARGKGECEIVRPDQINESTIPIGSVDFCAPFYGNHRVDFYPDFLRNHLHRDIAHSVGGFHPLLPVFVKDATCWKSLTPASVYPVHKEIPLGNYLLSDVVIFADEWRYYVAQGRIYASGWYRGFAFEETPPAIDVAFPQNFSGSVDFGRLSTGEIALVEAHAPFACGWYGDNHSKYIQWLADSWVDKSFWAL